MTLTRINEARFEVTLKDVGMENEGKKEEIRGGKLLCHLGHQKELMNRSSIIKPVKPVI